MANLKLSVAARDAANDTLAALVDAQTNPGKILLYSGTMPATPDTAPGQGNVLLATIILNKPSFAASDGGVAAAETPISSVTAAQNGTATWFRLQDGSGNAILDGTVGTSSGYALQGNVTQVVAGVQVTLNGFSLATPTTC